MGSSIVGVGDFIDSVRSEVGAPHTVRGALPERRTTV